MFKKSLFISAIFLATACGGPDYYNWKRSGTSFNTFAKDHDSCIKGADYSPFHKAQEYGENSGPLSFVNYFSPYEQKPSRLAKWDGIWASFVAGYGMAPMWVNTRESDWAVINVQYSSCMRAKGYSSAAKPTGRAPIYQIPSWQQKGQEETPHAVYPDQIERR